MKKTIAIFLLMAAVFGVFPAEIHAAEVPVQAPSCILVHDSGEVIFEKNADQQMPPASVTKIMTLLLVMEAIERGELNWNDKVIGSAHAASMGGSQIWLKEGEQFTVEEMVKCVAVASANDCSVALAEHIAGSEEAFVARMNERAQQLGMYNTSFANCCGLEAEGHVTTARDIARMSIELLRHEKITDYTTIWTDTVREGVFGLTNTNKMIRSYPGMIGLKTGYTSDAGYCLSGAAERDGMTLVAVVLRGESAKSRNSDVAALLNYGFANYITLAITPDQPLMPVPVEMGRKDCVAIALAEQPELLLERSRLDGLTRRLEIAECAEAPVKAGDVLGHFTVCDRAGETVFETDVVAAEEAARLGLMDLWNRLLSAALLRGGMSGHSAL